jgi:hypothetical protein
MVDYELDSFRHLETLSIYLRKRTFMRSNIVFIRLLNFKCCAKCQYNYRAHSLIISLHNPDRHRNHNFIWRSMFSVLPNHNFCFTTGHTKHIPITVRNNIRIGYRWQTKFCNAILSELMPLKYWNLGFEFRSRSACLCCSVMVKDLLLCDILSNGSYRSAPAEWDFEKNKYN